jgi:hypothetical protein
MPTPSHGWMQKLPRPARQPPLGTTPGPSSRWTMMTTDPKPPDGQAAALVAVADTHPEHSREHPLNVTPHQPTHIPGPLRGWMTTTTNPAKPPDGVAVALVTGMGLPPKWTLQITPSPVRLRDKGGGIRCEDMTPHELKTRPKSGRRNM